MPSTCHFTYFCHISTINMIYLILYVHKWEKRYCVINLQTSYWYRSKTNNSSFMKISQLIYVINSYTQEKFHVFWGVSFFFLIYLYIYSYVYIYVCIYMNNKYFYLMLFNNFIYLCFPYVILCICAKFQPLIWNI